MFTAKTISAAEARKIGLVDEVVPLDHLHEAALRFAHGEHAGQRPPLSPEYTALERFFASNCVETIHAGAADVGGDASLARAMKQVGGKGPVALRITELLIVEGACKSLDEGLQMEMAHVAEIFSTTNAHLGLTFRAKKLLGQPAFAGR